jgi:hypothetical protein
MVVGLLEHGFRDASTADPSPAGGPAAPDGSERVPDRIEQAPHFAITPAHIALTVAVAFQFRRQIYRTLARLRSLNPARYLVRPPARWKGLPVPRRARRMLGATPPQALGVERKQPGSIHLLNEK